MNGREHVGNVGVDAGLIRVGDPCYVIGKDASHGVEAWDDFCYKLFDDGNEVARGVSQPLGSEIGLSVQTTWGDGTYPVYVTRRPDGRISSVEIVFDEPFAEDESTEDDAEDDS